MKDRKLFRTILQFPVVFLFVALLAADGGAWSCKTHVFIAAEAGMANPEAACFPDMTRKEGEALLGPRHWHNAAPGTVVTPGYIERFRVERATYVKRGGAGPEVLEVQIPHRAGVLYSEIVETYRLLKGSRGWQRAYYLSVLAHYVADLSQPLHNFPHGNEPAADGRIYSDEGLWAKNAHFEFDAALDAYLPADRELRRQIYAIIRPPVILSDDDLKREVAGIANRAIALAGACYREKRPLTKAEAVEQVSRSISLLMAVMKETGR